MFIRKKSSCPFCLESSYFSRLVKEEEEGGDIGWARGWKGEDVGVEEGVVRSSSYPRRVPPPLPPSSDSNSF